MTVYYYCFKGTLAHANCISGSTSSVDNTNIATPRRTLAQFAVQFSTAAAGDQFLFAEGGCWDDETTGQIKNANSTAANPIIIGSYDATAVWSGGAGIKPIFLNTLAATYTINFNKGTLTHSEGHTIRGLDVRGAGAMNRYGLLGGGDMDAIIVEDCAFSGSPGALQVNSATNTSATSDGITSGWTIRRCTFSNHSGICCLTACSKLLIEHCTFDHCGTTVGDHGIYVGGDTVAINPVAISSITGDGTTATITTSTPHGIPSGAHFTVGVTGATVTGGGSGSFNCTGGVSYTAVEGAYVSPTVFTYGTAAIPVTGTPSAGSVGAYTIVKDVEIEDVVIRNNTLSEGHVGAAGQNNNAHIILHGRTKNALIENNTISESVASVNASSFGIEVDTGDYAQPEKYEGFNRIVIRNNTCIRLGVGIGVDIVDSALVENNYVYTDYVSGNAAEGVMMRSKFFQAALSYQVQPNKVIIRNNTVHLKNATNGAFGIGMRAHASDPLTGGSHQMYNNLVVLETPAVNTVTAFSTVNMTAGMFSLKDNNRVVYTGATVPKFENTFALGAQTTGGDTNTTMVSSTSLTADQPYFTAAATSPAVGSSSNVKDNGHATLKPYLTYGGLVRLKTPSDIGAYEIGAVTVVANCQTGAAAA